MSLRTITFKRYIIVEVFGSCYVRHFTAEGLYFRKVKWYPLYGYPTKHPNLLVCRLDARTLKGMKKVKIIENDPKKCKEFDYFKLK